MKERSRRMKKWAVAIGACVVATVVAASNSTAIAQSQRFSDVAAGHYAYEAIEWAAGAGVTLGYGDGTFKPQQPLTKSHAVVFMQRYYNEILQADQSDDFTRGDMMVLLKTINDGTLRGDTTQDPAPDTDSAAQSQRFSDVAAGHYAYEAIEWAAGAGVTLGYGDGTFKPQQPLTKSHAVVFMQRYYNEILQADQSDDFTRGDMMVLLKTINDGTLRDTYTITGSFKAVTVGDGHGCGLRTDNTITCWGNNYSGQANAPSGTFKAVTAGSSHSCGLRTDNTITCWGANAYWQDAPSGSFKAVTVGDGHGCGLRTDNTITCWGANYSGQANAPSGTFKAVTAGSSHSCGLRTDNTITCWGANAYWQDAPSGTFKAVTVGDGHGCGLRTDNTITCWGANAYWQDAPSGTFKAVTAGSSHSCGLRTDNTITCWGNNYSGQANAPSGTFKAVTAGSSHSCGLRTDNTITCWDDNWLGQTIESPEAEEEVDPHPCASVTSVSRDVFLHYTDIIGKIYIGVKFCCPNALQIDHNLRCFGDKGYEPDPVYFQGCSGGWVQDNNGLCPGNKDYGIVKCASGAIELIHGQCPGEYGYGYYGYGYGPTVFEPDLPYLKCSGGVIMDAYGRCPGDEFYYGEQQCPDGGSVIDYYGRCPSDDDYGMGWEE